MPILTQPTPKTLNPSSLTSFKCSLCNIKCLLSPPFSYLSPSFAFLYFLQISARRPPEVNVPKCVILGQQQQHKRAAHRLTWTRSSLTASRPKGQFGPRHLRGELATASQAQLGCTRHKSDCGGFTPPSVLVFCRSARSQVIALPLMSGMGRRGDGATGDSTQVSGGKSDLAL